MEGSKIAIQSIPLVLLNMSRVPLLSIALAT